MAPVLVGSIGDSTIVIRWMWSEGGALDGKAADQLLRVNAATVENAMAVDLDAGA